MGNWMMYWMMAPFAVLWLALIVGVLAAIVFAVVWAVRRSGQADHPTESPLAILERRYARGELSREQFGEMKRELTHAETP